MLILVILCIVDGKSIGALMKEIIKWENRQLAISSPGRVKNNMIRVKNDTRPVDNSARQTSIYLCGSSFYVKVVIPYLHGTFH